MCGCVQGLEKPIIILSTAVTRVGAFVADPHRLNVALTRAKHHLILVCCLSLPQANLPHIVNFTDRPTA